MAYRLHRHGDIAAELIRAAGEDLAAALDQLGAAAAPDQIHALRQRLKWVRSALRVLDPVLAEQARRVRRSVAQAARLLAGARDADVAAASARVLSATAVSAADAEFDRVADALDQEAAAAHQARIPLREVRRHLEDAAQGVARFSADFNGRELLERAIASAYRRARRAMHGAEAGRATPDLHRWRKQTKHLWHLLRMARALFDRPAKKTTARLDELAELLGLDHDHAMLAEKLALSTHTAALPRQLSLIAERRRGLEKDAFALGEKLFAARSRKFARRHALSD